MGSVAAGQREKERRWKRASGIVLLALLTVAGAVRGAQEPARAPRSEELRYRWRLEGVSSWISRLFGILPTTGDGLMALRIEPGNRLGVAFTATSEKADPDEYWKYETAVDLAAWRSLSVRETLHYGKKQKSESFDLTELDVLDVLSGLQQLRYVVIDDSERRTIWSDGRVYSVMVTFHAFERREFESRDLTVRHFSIRGIREPGQRFWKSRAELWIGDDAAALPVEMIYHQALGRLRMTLVGLSAEGDRSAAGTD